MKVTVDSVMQYVQVIPLINGEMSIQLLVFELELRKWV
jgi:hypothetical protein